MFAKARGLITHHALYSNNIIQGQSLLGLLSSHPPAQGEVASQVIHPTKLFNGEAGAQSMVSYYKHLGKVYVKKSGLWQPVQIIDLDRPMVELWEGNEILVVRGIYDLCKKGEKLLINNAQTGMVERAEYHPDMQSIAD
jgi:hypothetical protein